MTADSEDVKAVGAGVDVHAFAQEVRDEVDRKRQAGAYPADLLSRLEAPVGEKERADDALLTALAELKRSANFTSQVTTESRKPVIGPVVAKSRQLIRSGLSWYINGILAQLRSFARHVEGSILLLADRTKAAEARAAALEQRVAELERQLRERPGGRPEGGS
jgi:hypothetical protein